MKRLVMKLLAKMRLIRLVRFSVRCALRIGAEEMLVHVDPHSKKKKPAVWWFGGTVTGTAENVADLKKLGARGFEGQLGRRDDYHFDLSCWVPWWSWRRLRKWVETTQAGLDVMGTARSEIYQEFSDEELPSHLAEAVRYGKITRHDMVGILHTYLGEKVEGALCYTYVVQCSVPPEVERAIRKLVTTSGSLYLITPADVKHGFFWGTVDGQRTTILVPKVLSLMFQ